VFGVAGIFAVAGIALAIVLIHKNHTKGISDDDNIKSNNLKEAAKGLGVYMGASLRESYL
jgi:hypothetical protein